ncbi:hypothetical protein AWB81_08385 [Caballeronia arationis]|nr:hypothetical protein AWB81_08385 [Caballeronia arationis]
MLFVDLPTNSHELVGRIERDCRQALHVGRSVKVDADRLPRRRNDQISLGPSNINIPHQKALVTFLTVVESPDGTGIGHDAARSLPLLRLVDVSKHESIAFSLEQTAKRKLVVEPRHRHAVLGRTAVDRAVGDPDSTDACGAKLLVDAPGSSQIVTQHGFKTRPGFLGTDSGRQLTLVDGGQAGEHDIGADREHLA